MRRRHKAALAVAHVLVPLAASCGPATIAAPTARESTSTTSPEAEPPTSVVVVVPETEAADPQPAATGIGPTTTTGPLDISSADINDRAPKVDIPSNSVANGPLPVDVSRTLACIRAHESDTAGGYRAINPNGHYGAYQADEDFWASNGGDPSYSGHIQDAPPAMQDEVAANGLAARGTQPWGGVC